MIPQGLTPRSLSRGVPSPTIGLPFREMVWLVGFEPTASRIQTGRAGQAALQPDEMAEGEGVEPTRPIAELVSFRDCCRRRLSA